MQVVDFCHYDYLILGCGYVQRFYKHLDDIIKDEKDANDGTHSFLFLYHGNSVNILQPDDDDVSEAFLKIRDHLGCVRESVCLKGPHGDPEFAIERLRGLGHCSCWGDKPCQAVSFVTKNGKTVLYEEYDTESG